jgi:hypothetical protein
MGSDQPQSRGQLADVDATVRLDADLPPVTAGRRPLDRFAPAGAGNFTSVTAKLSQSGKIPDCTHRRAE